MLLFTSLYYSDPSGSNCFFLSSLLLLHRSRISAVTQGCFLLTMFAKDLTGCFNHCCVESGDHWIQVCVFIVHDGERCKLPTCNSWKVSNTLGSFSFLRSNLSLVCFGLLILFRRRWKVIISKSWSLPVSASGKLRVLAMFTPDRKRFLTRIYSVWLWCCPFGLCHVIFWMLFDDQKCWPTQDH